jgi:hypothetical protein
MPERKSVSSRVRGGASRATHAGKAAFDRLTPRRAAKPPAASSEQKPAAAATAEKESESASAEQ